MSSDGARFATYCMVSILKNEGPIIERLLGSVKDLVSDAVIVDTGSTDDMLEKIRAFPLPTTIFHRPFDNFRDSRNHALECARQTTHANYLLLIDGDHVLNVGDMDYMRSFHGDVMDMVQDHGSLSYRNVRIVRRTLKAEYIGRTHEYISVPDDADVVKAPMEAVFIRDVSDGQNRADKFQRDIRLLTEELQEKPDDPRTHFYLAESYCHAGQPEQAITYYLRRIELGGWHEEVSYSKYKILKSYITMGRLADARAWFDSQDLGGPDATRAESAYHLCKSLREAGQNNLAFLYYTMGARIPVPDDKTALFVEHDVYAYGLAYEASILWYYVVPPAHRAYGLRLSRDVMSAGAAPEESRKCIHDNLIFYVQPIGGEVVSSLAGQHWPGWFYTTPSFCGDDDVIYRLVNYSIRDDGSYNVLDNDGVVRTMNLWGDTVLDVVADPDVPTQPNASIMGLEDLRLTTAPDGTVWGMAASWEYASAPCTICQALYTVEDKRRVHVRAILSDGSRAEKNWVWADFPRIITDWYPAVRVRRIDTDALTVSVEREIPSPVLLRVADQRTPIRHYLHNFVVLDEDLTEIRRISLPFTFEKDADIEFCTALRLDEDGATVGYSVRDAAPRIRRLTWAEISRMFV